MFFIKKLLCLFFTIAISITIFNFNTYALNPFVFAFPTMIDIGFAGSGIVAIADTCGVGISQQDLNSRLLEFGYVDYDGKFQWNGSGTMEKEQTKDNFKSALEQYYTNYGNAIIDYIEQNATIEMVQYFNCTSVGELIDLLSTCESLTVAQLQYIQDFFKDAEFITTKKITFSIGNDCKSLTDLNAAIDNSIKNLIHKKINSFYICPYQYYNNGNSYKLTVKNTTYDTSQYYIKVSNNLSFVNNAYTGQDYSINRGYGTLFKFDYFDLKTNKLITTSEFFRGDSYYYDSIDFAYEKNPLDLVVYARISTKRFVYLNSSFSNNKLVINYSEALDSYKVYDDVFRSILMSRQPNDYLLTPLEFYYSEYFNQRSRVSPYSLDYYSDKQIFDTRFTDSSYTLPFTIVPSASDYALGTMVSPLKPVVKENVVSVVDSTVVDIPVDVDKDKPIVGSPTDSIPIAKPEVIVDSITDSITDSVTIPAVVPAIPTFPDIPDLTVPYNISNKFPFCLPFDLYRGFTLLGQQPLTPKFDFSKTITILGATIPFEFTLDFSMFDEYMPAIRLIETIFFTIFLIFATKKLVQGAGG